MIRLFKNARIATMDSTLPRASAVVTVGDYFACVGTEEQCLEYVKNCGGEAEVIDLQGRRVIPGMTDSHQHYLHVARSAACVNLFDCTSMAGMKARLKAALADLSEGLWLVGEGWNQDYFEDEKRFPTAADLDEVSADIPVVIMRACFHIGSLNTAAMKVLGIDAAFAAENPENVEILPDGSPNGVVKEYVLDNLIGRLPIPNEEGLSQMMLDLQQAYFAQGITSVQSDDFIYSIGDGNWTVFDNAVKNMRNGKMKLRYFLQAKAADKADAERLLSHIRRDPAHISAVKLFADGSLGARTAWVRQDYADAPGKRGIPVISREELFDIVMMVHECNIPVAIHAIGDAAIELALDAIENAKKRMPHLSPRHSIVHCQITDKKLLERFRDLDVVAHIQPIFIDYDMHIVKDRVGDELASTSYAWNTMKKMGICHPFGTDSPVTPFDTMPNIYTAVSRRDLRGRGPYLPEEALTVEEAVYAYTAEPAYACGEENIRGKIKAGMLADMVVLDRDIFELPHEEILKTKVVATYIGGEKVY